MPEVLLWTLWAPLGALGGLAVGERRLSGARPARSAILGMVGAALGIERADAEAQSALQEDYRVAVRTLRSGALLTDFHTAQVPPAGKGKQKGQRYRTRRDQLARPRHELGTILSLREYREEPAFTLALWASPDPRWPLATIATALTMPRFVLFMGRKSCPLGLPPDPLIVRAADLASSFTAYDAHVAQDAVRSSLHRKFALDVPERAALHAERDSAMPLGVPITTIAQRRDVARDRLRWTFDEREELACILDYTPAPSSGALP